MSFLSFLKRRKFDNFVFAIGPSGAGKSNIVQKWSRLNESNLSYEWDWVVHMHITQNPEFGNHTIQDIYNKLGPNEFFEAGVDILTGMAGDGPIVIDAGAGFQTSRNSYDFFRDKKCVLITASPSVAYKRHLSKISADMSFDAYNSSEFSDYRMGIYEIANHVIDTDHVDTDEAVDRFAEAIDSLIRR